MKKLSVPKKNKAFNLLVEYFNLTEFNRFKLIGGVKSNQTRQEDIEQSNYINDKLREIAHEIASIIHDPINRRKIGL